MFAWYPISSELLLLYGWPIKFEYILHWNSLHFCSEISLDKPHLLHKTLNEKFKLWQSKQVQSPSLISNGFFFFWVCLIWSNLFWGGMLLFGCCSSSCNGRVSSTFSLSNSSNKSLVKYVWRRFLGAFVISILYLKWTESIDSLCLNLSASRISLLLNIKLSTLSSSSVWWSVGFSVGFVLLSLSGGKIYSEWN